VIRAGPVTLDAAEHTITCNGRPLQLTVMEFRLLRYLLSHAGRVVPTEELQRRVWGAATGGGPELVRVTIHRLRRKLHEDAARPQFVHTVPGVGFVFRP
jgi:DNA-binding response OmpR family regulator